MTPDEVATLVGVGESYYGSLVNLIGTCAMYGLYLLSLFTALYMFCSKSVKGLTQRTLLALLVIVCFSITGDCISRTGTIPFINYFSLMHPSTTEDLLANVSLASDRAIPWEAIQFWGPTINLCIGDGLVLWRAWVILDFHQGWRGYLLGFLLLLLMVGNIGVNVADAAFDDIGLNIQLSDGAITLDWVSLVVSLTVNAFATLLIGLKAWALYRSSNSVNHIQTRHFQVKKALLILVESGLVFCLVQIVYAVLNGVEINNTGQETSAFFAYAIFTAVANGCAALYPVAIIIIVHMEASPLIASLASRSETGFTYAMEMHDMESRSRSTAQSTQVSKSRRVKHSMSIESISV